MRESTAKKEKAVNRAAVEPASMTIWTVSRSSEDGAWQLMEKSGQQRPRLLIASPDQRYFNETVYELVQRKKEQSVMEGHVIQYQDLTTPLSEMLGREKFDAFLQNLDINSKNVSNKMEKNKKERN